MKPYYEEAGITIYHGDCREILPQLPNVDAVITDPVWPNSSPLLIGADRPVELFAEMASLLPGLTTRLVIHLGCDSDPKMLSGVPDSFKFFRVCWLEYACPKRKGRLLYTGDVAYVYGPPVASKPKLRVISGRYMSTRSDSHRTRLTKYKEYGKAVEGLHPCPRRLQHLRWLVSRFAEGTVLDPFAGSGTTLIAAKINGLSAIGIEIEERYCEIAANRLRQSVLNFEVA
jgi:site-specific DNA-methyltransferase (adenine-specific)